MFGVRFSSSVVGSIPNALTTKVLSQIAIVTGVSSERTMSAHWITFQVILVLFLATVVRSAFGFGEALISVPLLAFVMPVEESEEKTMPMKKDFKVGDHVGWNSEAGRVRGTIKKKIISAITFKGYTVHASKEEPQYLIKSDITDHLAMHKGSALNKLQK